jgi:hypothetical protein
MEQREVEKGWTLFLWPAVTQGDLMVMGGIWRRTVSSTVSFYGVLGLYLPSEIEASSLQAFKPSAILGVARRSWTTTTPGTRLHVTPDYPPTSSPFGSPVKYHEVERTRSTKKVLI